MNLEDILEKVKDIISIEKGNKRIFDKDIAFVLFMDDTKLSKLKKKNKIPFEELSIFAAKRKLSINWLLFDQEPKSLEESTSKYLNIRYLSSDRALI